MNVTTIVTVIVILAAVVMVGTLAYLYLKNSTLEDIRKDVYHLFLQAEHRYTETGAGKQKMKWVISRARKLLPKWLQAFVTEEALYGLVQSWFDAIKDLLDDGKFNRSEKEETENE